MSKYGRAHIVIRNTYFMFHDSPGSTTEDNNIAVDNCAIKNVATEVLTRRMRILLACIRFYSCRTCVEGNNVGLARQKEGALNSEKHHKSTSWDREPYYV
jgi:hypothetical protein